jgi:hypothetical protein
MYKNIGEKGLDRKTKSPPHNVCSIIMGVFIVISIILFIIGIVMFLQPPKKIAPLRNHKNPKNITYNGEPVSCTNLNLITVKSYTDKNNRTLYTIKSTPNAQYNNAISLSSGAPRIGFYSCKSNNSCLTYNFIYSVDINCTDNEKIMTFTKNQNCIGGRGCHWYNKGPPVTVGIYKKYPLDPYQQQLYAPQLY